MPGGPHRHHDFEPRCRELGCEAVAAAACRRCGRPLCHRCEPARERRCGHCEGEWIDIAERLSSPAPPRPLRTLATHVVLPSLIAAALAFAVLSFGGGSVLGPLAMALALVAAVNAPLLALGPRELASEIGEVRVQARVNAARHRFLAQRPPRGRAARPSGDLLDSAP